jgi:hypothetical protein
MSEELKKKKKVAKVKKEGVKGYTHEPTSM